MALYLQETGVDLGCGLRKRLESVPMDRWIGGGEKRTCWSQGGNVQKDSKVSVHSQARRAIEEREERVGEEKMGGRKKN